MGEGEQARAPEGGGEEQSQGSEGRVTGQIGGEGSQFRLLKASHKQGLTGTNPLGAGEGRDVTGYRE